MIKYTIYNYIKNINAKNIKCIFREILSYRKTTQLIPFDIKPTYLENIISDNGGILYGICPICNKETQFLFPHDMLKKFIENGIDEDIFPSQLYTMREGLICNKCGSANRERQIAWLIKNIYKCKSLSDIFTKTIYLAESSSQLYNILHNSPYFHCSEYFGNKYKHGEIVDFQGKLIRNEDIQHLSFDSDSIDIVITRDVFEHIPNPYKAHQEIFRVLKKGGRHFFTVPFFKDSCNAYNNIKRAEIKENKIVYYMKPQYHINPLDAKNGSLVYNIFSYEMMIQLKHIGFNPSVWHIYEPCSGIIGPNALVFIAEKSG